MGSKVTQLFEDFTFCLNGVASVAHVIGWLFQFRIDIGRDGVGAIDPRRHPNGKDMLPIYFFNRGTGHIIRLKHVVVVVHLALDVVDFGKRQTCDRSYWHPINGLYSDKDITASIVFNIVGEGTDRAVDSSRVSAFLEFDSVGLDLAFVEQIVDVGE